MSDTAHATPPADDSATLTPQTTPATSPAATPTAGDADAQFLASLPEDIRGNASLSKFSSMEALARGYLNAEQLIGRDKVPLPKDDADQEAWERWYTAAGRPEAPEKYAIQKPEQLPEGVVYDEQMETWWRQEAHAAGLSNRQAAKLYESYRDRVFAGNEASTAQAREEVTRGTNELKRDWGAQYPLKLQLARAEFNSFPESVQQALTRAGLQRNVNFIKHLAETRSRVTGELETATLEEGARVLTPEQIDDKIAEHRSKYSTSLMDKNHPEHDLRLRELNALYQAKYPEDQK